MIEIILAVLISLTLFMLKKTIYTVNEGNIAIIERLGKFYTIGKPGLNFKIPFIDSIKGYLISTVWNLIVKVETKTLDNVFVDITVNTQCKNIQGKEFEASYLISSENLQAYISDAIRALAPLYTLDKLFQQKDELAKELKNDLSPIFEKYGYQIINTLITDLSPDEKVKNAMNEINESQRLRVAAAEKAEAEKITIVKAAEAQAESRILQGKGVAGQRKAIIEGLRESLDELKNNKGSDPITEQDAIVLLLLNQYFDTLKDIGSHSKSNTVFLDHAPAGLNNIVEQMKKSLTEANLISKNLDNI